MSDKAWLILFALALGGGVGYLNSLEIGLSLPVLLLSVSGLLLGGLAPREAWLWAALLGLSILAAYGVASFFGVAATELIPMMALPLFFALLGTVLSLFVRRLSTVPPLDGRGE